MQMTITPTLINAIKLAATALHTNASTLEHNMAVDQSKYVEEVKQILTNSIEENRHAYAILVAWLERVDKNAKTRTNS